MKVILAMALLVSLAACAAKPSNELESMTKDVLRSRQGVDIEIKPIPKEIH
jgi:type IV pilus biogenesis protein CpaD/CtpE